MGIIVKYNLRKWCVGVWTGFMCLKIVPLACTVMNPDLHKIEDILLAAIIGFSKRNGLWTWCDSTAINAASRCKALFLKTKSLVRCFTIMGKWFPVFRTVVPCCSRLTRRRKIRLLHNEDKGTTVLRIVGNCLPTDTERHSRRIVSSETSNCQTFLRNKKKMGNFERKYHSANTV
jgi:hypothetical protein